MNKTERKFTFGKLEIRNFISSDYIYLVGFFISILIYLYVIKYRIEDKFIVTLIISWFIGFQTISSPFGLRFRNVYFSIIWLTLSLTFLIENNGFNMIPITTFFLYHIIRQFFWFKFKREFIPYETGKGSMFRYKSFFEGRSGYKEDRFYTKILLIIGNIILILCLIQFIRIDGK